MTLTTMRKCQKHLAVTQGFRTNDISVWIKERKVYFLPYCHRREKFTSVTVIVVSYK